MTPKFIRLGAIAVSFVLADQATASRVLEPRRPDTRNACIIAPRFPEVTVRFPDPGAVGDPKPSNEDRKESDGSFYYLSQAACSEFRNSSTEFIQVDTREWVRRADFIRPEDMERIHHWTTRYLYENAYIHAGPSDEIGHYQRFNREVAIDAYQAATIRDKVRLFKSDGHFVDTALKMDWEMRWSPTGKLFLVDPDGKYLPETFNMSNSFSPACIRRGDGQLECGFGYQGYSSGNGFDAMGVYPGKDPFNSTIGRISRLSEKERIYDVRPDKILIRTPYTAPDGFTEAFYARFDDPVRPVVFAPGTLFTRNAKPHPGKPRPGEVVMKEVCIADCPDQLELQK